ncbi:STM4504/CBY_0614 family protein [Pseudovibrio ascidiaceicola]|uniref:STM4504/CBY_0614 family protein n=1 Tax=Pseudovibrio ascidiaceicola TaxID=285279 RepID=UPI003D35C0C8
MAVSDVFWKRQKRLRGEMPDIYVYDAIPEGLRVQIVQIMVENLGTSDELYSRVYGARIKSLYESIVSKLTREMGVFHLPPASRSGLPNIELTNYLLTEERAEYFLSAVELICKAISRVTSKFEYKHNKNSRQAAQAAINEINTRFKEHGFGYEYDEEIIRIDDEFIHAEAVKPALALLHNDRFRGAEQEFRNAHEHYRKGKHKEALNDALKAFESTMKCIYDRRNWAYDERDTASKLLKVGLDNGLIPSFWQTHFGALKTTLEASVPTARNRLSGHGQDQATTSIPEHLVAYVLHQTASAIVFLVKSDEALQLAPQTT